MSNVIKSFSAEPSEAYVIDNENSEIGRELNERIKKYQSASQNSGGFSMGLQVSELDEEDYERLLNAEEESSEANEELDQEAEKILERARADAEEILIQARAEIEDAKEIAAAQGREQGYNEGMANAQAEIEELKAQLKAEQEQVISETQAEYDMAIDALEPQFADLTCRLIERLTGVVVTGHREVILYLINNAMRGIENSHSFVISLSEEDYAYVDKNKDNIYGYLNPSTKIDLFSDPNLAKNQCKIETENGLTDLSLDVQQNQLIKTLLLLNS